MWFTRFGEYVNRGWREAALFALIFSLIPLMGWIAVVIMALFTMRKGALQGFIILLATVIPSLVFIWFGKGTPWVITVLFLCGNVLTWLLAIILRQTSDWGKVLLSCMLISAIIVIMLHWLVPDLNGYWFNMLNKLYSQADKDAQSLLQLPPNMDMKSYLTMMAKVLTPLLILTQVILALSNLFLARWWQASLYNPGGLWKELLQLRLSYWCSVILAATIEIGRAHV